MKNEKFLIQSLHNSTKRNYLDRMNDDKVNCMIEAKKYGPNYWDGDRRFGYGGYAYIPGRWREMAMSLIKEYRLNNNSKILDIGCGKGFLLYEIQMILPQIRIVGIDISEDGLNKMHPNLKAEIYIKSAADVLEFEDKEFDLAISINTFHNLKLFQLELALKEMERVSKSSYIVLESYRNELEQFNLQCWALTAETIICKEDWIWLYNKCGYTGDYEFIYFT